MTAISETILMWPSGDGGGGLTATGLPCDFMWGMAALLVASTARRRWLSDTRP